MCTVTWTRATGGYDLFFNRDERRTRKPALPPTILKTGNTSYIAPRDGDHGGTWIAVNEHGLTLALLNHYPAESAAANGGTSRGHVVTSLIDAPDARAAAGRLNPAALAAYRPFLLIAIDTAAFATLHQWDGHRLGTRCVPDSDVPVSTSSFESAAVVARRRERFAAMREQGARVDVELLMRYHTSRDEKGDAFSVFMQRPDAQTVSISRVEVRPGRAAFTYWPREAIEAGAMDAEPAVLERK
jgi:uncharacterized protein with NRDE domain